MFLSVVIPTYNEEARIIKTLKIIRNFLIQQKYSSEVIVVDDGSFDQTCQLVLKFPWPKQITFSLIDNKTNHGKGYVVKYGMLTAKGEYLLFTDADCSTPIEEINKLLPYRKQFSVIIGSRYLKKASIKRKQKIIRQIIGRVGMFLTKLVVGLPVNDTQCGFKLFSKKASKEIFLQSTINRWGFDIEILAIANSLDYQIKEVAVSWYDDPNSKLRASRAIWQTLIELGKIKINILKGKYKKTDRIYPKK